MSERLLDVDRAGCDVAERRGIESPGTLGIITDPHACRRNQLLNLVSMGVPATGMVLAITSIPTLGFTGTTAVVFLVFLLINSIGIELGLHRYYTHRAFKTGPVLHAVLGVLGTWAFQGPIARWVADHRRHHRFPDQPNDPHSPYWREGVRITDAWKGFLWSHVLWMLRGKVSDPRRYAPDVIADPVSSWLSKFYWPVAIAGLLLPAVIGYALGGWDEFMRCLLWAGCVRVFLLHQFTWSVNSIAHTFGTQEDGARDQSRNNRIVAVLTLGSGLHGYHHRFPAAAVNRPLQWDPIGVLVILLRAAGVVREVRMYP